MADAWGSLAVDGKPEKRGERQDQSRGHGEKRHQSGRETTRAYRADRSVNFGISPSRPARLASRARARTKRAERSRGDHQRQQRKAQRRGRRKIAFLNPLINRFADRPHPQELRHRKFSEGHRKHQQRGAKRGWRQNVRRDPPDAAPTLGNPRGLEDPEIGPPERARHGQRDDWKKTAAHDHTRPKARYRQSPGLQNARSRSGRLNADQNRAMWPPFLKFFPPAPGARSRFGNNIWRNHEDHEPERPEHAPESRLRPFNESRKGNAEKKRRERADQCRPRRTAERPGNAAECRRQRARLQPGSGERGDERRKDNDGSEGNGARPQESGEASSLIEQDFLDGLRRRRMRLDGLRPVHVHGVGGRAGSTRAAHPGRRFPATSPRFARDRRRGFSRSWWSSESECSRSASLGCGAPATSATVL